MSNEIYDKHVTNFDLWNNKTKKTLGRHYLRANIISKMTNVNNHSLIFDNDIYDFYLSF